MDIVANEQKITQSGNILWLWLQCMHTQRRKEKKRKKQKHSCGCGCGYTLKSCGCPLNFRVVVRALFMTITKVRVTAVAKK